LGPESGDPVQGDVPDFGDGALVRGGDGAVAVHLRRVLVEQCEVGAGGGARILREVGGCLFDGQGEVAQFGAQFGGAVQVPGAGVGGDADEQVQGFGFIQNV
jgi:hypothetical protein